MMCSNIDCGMNPLKPMYSNFKSTTNFIKYSGLMTHVRQKSILTRHQCEVCDKTFQNKMMKEFHKRIHPRQLPSKDCKDNLNMANNLIEKSESGKQNQLQKSLQSGEQTVDIFSRF